MNQAKPFVKWAGGKTQLLAQFENYYPNDLRTGKIDRYIEPFVGGGAVFFAIMQKYPISYAYISDINNDLILTYRVIQQNPVILLEYLEQYQHDHDSTTEADRQQLFSSVRRDFNAQRFAVNYQRFSELWAERAAQLIFLNKTCFNGLFRLNSKGEFNVPSGRYKNPAILDRSNILAVSKILRNTEIQMADYEICYDEADEKTFIYFDPPYRPVSKTASFTRYAGFEFTDQEQIKLANFFRKLDREKYSKLMLSNSDSQDHFFAEIYANYNIYRVYANRMINCCSDKRGQINELVITNYKPQTFVDFQ